MAAATPTDWDVTRQTLAQMFSRFDDLEGVESVILYDARYSSDQAGYLVSAELARVLGQKGIEVYISSPLNAEPQAELRYLTNQLRVVHKRSYRKLLVGPRMIERWVQADIELTLLEDGRVISQKRLVAEEESTFPEKDLDLVRSSALTQEYYTSSTAGSLWEPLLVTAVVGTLIYLFYAPRD